MFNEKSSNYLFKTKDDSPNLKNMRKVYFGNGNTFIMNEIIHNLVIYSSPKEKRANYFKLLSFITLGIIDFTFIRKSTFNQLKKNPQQKDIIGGDFQILTSIFEKYVANDKKRKKLKDA